MTSYHPRHSSKLTCCHVRRIPATKTRFQFYSCSRFVSCFKRGQSAPHPSTSDHMGRTAGAAAERAPCHRCPDLSLQLPTSLRLRQGLLGSTSLALATRARQSLFLRRANAPRNIGLPISIFSSKSRSSPKPTPGAGKGSGQVAIVAPCAGKCWLSAG